MHYLGGKARLARHIVPSIVGMATGSTGRYVEPFMGGGSMVAAVCESKAFSRYEAGDLQPDLVLMWQAMIMGWEPPHDVDEKLYASLKGAPPSALRGFVGFGCSFGGKWFGGFAREGTRGHRNYAGSAARVCAKKVAHMRAARLRIHRRSYLGWNLDEGDVVYCDPPYLQTEGYDAHEEPFDHAEFWSWADQQRRRDVRIVVSESTPPPGDGWAQVWWVEREINVTRIDGQSPGQIFDALYVPDWLARRAVMDLPIRGGRLVLEE